MLELWVLSFLFWAHAETKKVIEILPLQTHQIEMPDGSVLNFGADYQASLLESLLASQKYIVVDQSSDFVSQDLSLPKMRYLKWMGSFTPVARLKVETRAYSFEAGTRGERMFYGFNDRVSLPKGLDHEEFPLRGDGEAPSWFGTSFDRKGVVPFDSRAGLDLGDTFKLSLPFSSLSLKYQKYHSDLHLVLRIEIPHEKQWIQKEIQVKGKGFYLDFVGAYDGFSLGISFARKDAMQQALNQALKSSIKMIHQALEEVPVVAQIDAIMKDGRILLGTGESSNLPKGFRFRSPDHPGLLVEVESSSQSGSIGNLLTGNSDSLRSGMLLSQERMLPRARFLGRDESQNEMSSEMIELPDEKLLATWKEDYLREKRMWHGFATRLATSLSLPYRFWRYFQYDRPYQVQPDRGSKKRDLTEETWASQIGLESAPPMARSTIASVSPPLIAIVDSGMDYNAAGLHSSLWLNSKPKTDSHGSLDRYGWDFISNDSRPYDDGYHGTQIASLIHAVAPEAKLMPLKVFNAWGITRSAALYSALVYAVDHGAQVIVCAWKTPVRSLALQKGLQYAFDHKVIVVTSAGEDGSLSYPSSFSEVDFGIAGRDLLLRVAAVDSKDRLLPGERKAFDLAAPGMDIRVLEPRSGEGTGTGSDYATALVAGGLGRVIAQKSGGEAKEWIRLLLADSESIPPINGLRLRIKR